jgi:hypothetical protein
MFLNLNIERYLLQEPFQIQFPKSLTFLSEIIAKV